MKCFTFTHRTKNHKRERNHLTWILKLNWHWFSELNTIFTIVPMEEKKCPTWHVAIFFRCYHWNRHFCHHRYSSIWVNAFVLKMNARKLNFRRNRTKKGICCANKNHRICIKCSDSVEKSILNCCFNIWIAFTIQWKMKTYLLESIE